jgi:hypothetical protein
MKNVHNAKVEKIGGCFFVTDSAGNDRAIFSKAYDTEKGATRFLSKYLKMIGA